MWSLYQQKIIKNYQNYLAKVLKDQFIGINIKQKQSIKIQQMNIYFLNSNFGGVTYCLFQFIQIKMAMRKGFSYEDTSYQQVLYKIITSSSMEKNIYDQPIDSDIKRYKEIRKLTTG